MPNLPLMVGEGMSVFCLGAKATVRDRRIVDRLLAKAPEERFQSARELFAMIAV